MECSGGRLQVYGYPGNIFPGCAAEKELFELHIRWSAFRGDNELKYFSLRIFA